MATEFRLLGEVEAVVDGAVVDLGHARQRTVLVALLVEANRPVAIDVLVDRLWGEQVPLRAHGTVHSYLSRLRKALKSGTDVEIVRQSSGYVLTVDQTKVDLHRFRELVAEARAAEDDQAARLFDEALTLWRGRAFGGAESPWLDGVRDGIDRDRLAARLDRNDVRLRLGGHGALLAELFTLAADHPLDERLAGQLMLALHRNGRQADALLRFDLIRSTLAEELGIDPSAPLRDLHQRILAADLPEAPALPTVPMPSRPVPAQLPADVTHFTGRTTDTDRLSALLATHDSTRVTIASIEGTAGVGKTALAVRFAHQVAARFPDGQLFLNLRSYGPGEPISVGVALTALLQGVGVTGSQIPADLDSRAALWRTNSAGRRLLILLDNAHDTTQIRRLLPGPGSLVILTSRTSLRGLVVRDGAQQVALTRLPVPDALAMLRRIIGDRRVADEPEDAERILDVCARLPLAIRILGERADRDPDVALGSLLRELAEESDRLTAFNLDDDEETDLRSVFNRSYDALDPEAARLFRLLGTQDVVDFSAESAAAVGGITSAVARSLLDKLVARNLLERPRPGRHQFHDLMREFAAGLARVADSPDFLRHTTQQLLQWYLRTLTNAGKQIDPNRTVDPTVPGPIDIEPQIFSSQTVAMSWCDNELMNMVTLVASAGKQGMHEYVARFPETLFRYLVTRAHQSESWIPLHQQALSAARSIGNHKYEVDALNGLAVVHAVLDRNDEAITILDEMLRVARENRLVEREYSALNNLAIVYRRAGRRDQCLEYSRHLLAVASTMGAAEEASAWVTLASAYKANGDNENAIRHAEAGLAMCLKFGRTNSAGSALHTLGDAYAGLGDSASSIASYERAIEIYRTLDIPYLVGQVLVDLGDVHASAHDSVRARECWQKAVAIYSTTGSPRIANVLAKLGEIGQ